MDNYDKTKLFKKNNDTKSYCFPLSINKIKKVFTNIKRIRDINEKMVTG